MPFSVQGAGAGASAGSGIGGLVGGIATLAGLGGAGGAASYKKALEIVKALQTPDFDMSQISPEDWQIVGEYFPEVYEAVLPEGPQTVQDSTLGRNAQVQALQEMSQVAEGGMPLVDRLQADQYQQSLLGALNSNRQAALEDMAMRGMSGSYPLEALGGQQAMDTAAGYGADMASQGQMRRLQAIAQMGDMGGALRAGDVDVSSRNADVVNRFNEFVSGMRTRAAEFGAGARGAARDRNVGERQRVGDYNRRNRQDTLTGNLERKNRLIQGGFMNELARAGLLSGAYTQYGALQDAEKLAKERAIGSIGAGIGGLAGGGLGGFG